MRNGPDHFRRLIEKALDGRSVAGAATRAGLPRSAIASVLKGHDPKLSRVAEICEALDLELYIGPRRETPQAPAPPEPESTMAPDAARGAGGLLGYPLEAARAIQRSAWEMVRLATAAGRNPIPRELWPIIATQFGEEPPVANGTIPTGARPVDVIELEAAAGGSGEPMRNAAAGRVWFRQGWLERRGLEPEHCVVMSVAGDSMAPAFPDGCSVLVNRAATAWEPPGVYIVRTADGLVIKRAARADDGAALMRSDNPDWPEAPLPEAAEIVGRVRWMAQGI